jgi:hypothetical protein
MTTDHLRESGPTTGLTDVTKRTAATDYSYPTYFSFWIELANHGAQATCPVCGDGRGVPPTFVMGKHRLETSHKPFHMHINGLASHPNNRRDTTSLDTISLDTI